MKTKNLLGALATLAITVTAALAADSLPATNDDASKQNWFFDITPYLWVPTANVETSLPSTPSGVDQFATRISAGAMLAAQARYRALGLFVDFDWVELNSVALYPNPAFSEVNLRSDFFHTTVAATYQLADGDKFHAGLLAGAVIWHVNEELNFSPGVLPGFESSYNNTWADPVVGGNIRYDLTRHWNLTTRDMVGGFGVGSQILVDVFGGVGYRFNKSWSTALGYRYLYEEYDRSGFKLNLDLQGAILGVSFSF